MKVLVTGAAGQLGQALQRSVPSCIGGHPVELILCSRTGGNGILSLDLVDAAACRALVQEFKPDWLINAGAYTAVDGERTIINHRDEALFEAQITLPEPFRFDAALADARWPGGAATLFDHEFPNRFA